MAKLQSLTETVHDREQATNRSSDEYDTESTPLPVEEQAVPTDNSNTTAIPASVPHPFPKYPRFSKSGKSGSGFIKRKGINLRPIGVITPTGGMYTVSSQEKPLTGRTSVKVLLLALLMVATSILSIGLYDKFFQSSLPLDKTVVVNTKYTDTYWQSYGEVFEPLVSVPIYFPEDGFKSEEFLLDSGAVVSSLPRERAAELGLSLAKLPRIVFGGFGGTTSFGYQSNIKIMVGGDEVSIPVVFTESEGTKPILGRSGFFEQYSVIFNARSRRIEIVK